MDALHLMIRLYTRDNRHSKSQRIHIQNQIETESERLYSAMLFTTKGLKPSILNRINEAKASDLLCNLDAPK